MEQPASHPAVRLPRRWRAGGQPDAAGSGAAAPGPPLWRKEICGAAPRRGDDGDDRDRGQTISSLSSLR